MIFTILLVILGIALIVVFMNRDKDEDKARLAIMGLTVAIVVLAILRLVGVGSGGASAVEYDVAGDRSIGEVIADRVAEVATGRRTVIVADLQSTDPFAIARRESFQERLQAQGFEILAVEHVRPPSALEPGERYPSEGLDARGLEEALRLHPEAEVLVSLDGFPEHNFDRIQRQLAKVDFFVFDQFTVYNWQEHVARGTIDGIVLQPIDADWRETSAVGEELFNMRYVFVTAQNLAEMRPRVEFNY